MYLAHTIKMLRTYSTVRSIADTQVFLFCLFSFFSFCPGFGFGEFGFVGKRYIPFHRTVIQRVNGAFFQIAEQAVHIDHPADTEPECGNKRHDPRYQQCGDKEACIGSLRQRYPNENTAFGSCVAHRSRKALMMAGG